MAGATASRRSAGPVACGVLHPGLARIPADGAQPDQAGPRSALGPVRAGAGHPRSPGSRSGRPLPFCRNTLTVPHQDCQACRLCCPDNGPAAGQHRHVARPWSPERHRRWRTLDINDVGNWKPVPWWRARRQAGLSARKITPVFRAPTNLAGIPRVQFGSRVMSAERLFADLPTSATAPSHPVAIDARSGIRPTGRASLSRRRMVLGVEGLRESSLDGFS